MGEKRELEVLLASVKKSEEKKRRVKTVRNQEREREPPRRAGEVYFEEGRKTEKELRRDREREKVKSKQKNTQERRKDREYDVTLAAYISTEWYAVTHASPYPSRFNIITRVRLSENEILSG